MIKRFLIFYGYYYCERGGWLDFQASFDTKDEAYNFLKKIKNEDEQAYDWYQVIDIEAGEEV